MNIESPPPLEKHTIKFDRESLKTGIPLIDQQHADYMDLVEWFFQLSFQNADFKKLQKALNEVTVYTVDHFDAEEYLMRSSNYPYYAEHCAKHDLFREKVNDFTNELEEDAGSETYLTRIANWLVDWFIGQVQVDDMKLAIFLKGYEMRKEK